MATEQERNRGAGAYSTPGVDVKPDTAPSPIITSSPIVSFSFKGIGPPSNLYITRDDRLFMSGDTQIAANETITYVLRILRVDGQIVTSVFVTPITAFVVNSQTQNLTEGFLLSVAAVASQATTRGQTFARAMIIRPGGAPTNIAFQLFADYITATTLAGWPNGRSLSPTEGPGQIVKQSVTNPAAGADWTLSVAVQSRWRIVSFSTLFITSAAVANRNVQVKIDDGLGNPMWIHDVAAAIPASTTQQIEGTTTNAPTGVVATIQEVVLPPGLILPPGFRVFTQTQNIQAADQWSSINFLVEQWIDNP